MINTVKNSQQLSNNQITDANYQQYKTNQTMQVAGENITNPDTVEIGTASLPSVVYTKTNLQKSGVVDMEALQQQAEKATENLRTLVEKLILKQGKHIDVFNTKGKNPSGIGVNAAEQAEIADDDDFGVEAVSDRIVSFAIAISGEDKTKLSELKVAIDKGFAEAKKAFGGELPDICGQTYEAIMKKLDDWSQEK